MNQPSTCRIANFLFCLWLTLALLLPPPIPAHAQTSPTAPVILPAPIVNDEGGPVALVGELAYTNPFFTVGVAAPLIVLEDQAGFVDRNPAFLLPPASQTLGQITSDFFTSPFSYTLALPIEPQGTLRDLDQDANAESGVMVFAVAYWTNKFGDPFLEERDLFGGGWSTAYASTRVSDQLERRREIVGGRLLVYAPAANQGFPNDFGPDQRLFTADDPVVTLPQGYTLVDLDTRPFTFDRRRLPLVDLIEPDFAALEDFSPLGYVLAFDAMLEKLRVEYAFTEYKSVDWDALAAEYRPRLVAAGDAGDSNAYRRALSDFSYEIPDGHIQGPVLAAEIRRQIEGGVGMALRELDDGTVLVVYITPGGPAESAGIQVGDAIIAFDEQPIGDFLDNITPWNGPFSTDHAERLQQLRFATRFPRSTTVEVGYLRDSSTPVTASLTAIGEVESFNYGIPTAQRTGFELPLEYEQLASGYGYVSIYSFLDNDQLTVQLWERLMDTLNRTNTRGLIIDLRDNGGGSGFLADQMAAYFFDEALTLGNTGRYNRELGDFYFDPRTEERFYLPPTELRYDGEIVVLVGPSCASACEFFAYDLTLQDRATIVGHYPTAGLGGSIDQFIMPGNVTFQFTNGRAVDVNGDIHIEGKGIAPDIRVPVTAATLLAEDAVLDAAIEHLDGAGE